MNTEELVCAQRAYFETGATRPLEFRLAQLHKLQRALQDNEALLESAMSTAVIDGHDYALALNTNSKIVFCNTAMLEAAGVGVPTTIEEWAQALRSLSGENENGQQIWGWNEPALAGWNLCPFIWSFGGSLTDV